MMSRGFITALCDWIEAENDGTRICGDYLCDYWATEIGLRLHKQSSSIYTSKEYESIVNCYGENSPKQSKNGYLKLKEMLNKADKPFSMKRTERQK